MTQYNNRVEEQRLKLEAEEWAGGVKSLHGHSLNSLWYADGRSDGSVLDIMYNDGSIERQINSTGETVILGERLTGQDLVNSYVKGIN
tara:strand:+ start:276 stop:539 length:264 start_codon:yes stop_codon:yes gene_type:complete